MEFNNFFRLLSKLFSSHYMKESNIVLHEKKVIYFPIPKNGCTTIKSVLKYDFWNKDEKEDKYLKRSSVHAFNFPFVRKNIIYVKYSDYFRFAIIRNPWDRLVSLYNNKILQDKNMNYYPFIPMEISKRNFDNIIVNKLNKKYFNLINRIYYVDHDAYIFNKKSSEEDIRELRKMLKSLNYYKGISSIFRKYRNKFWAGMSFQNFVYSIVSIPHKESDVHFKPQHLFFIDRKGNLLANHIGKFHEFDKELNILMDKLDIHVNAPHYQKGGFKKYQKYYSNETKKLVEKYYKEDIKIGGFTFEND